MRVRTGSIILAVVGIIAIAAPGAGAVVLQARGGHRVSVRFRGASRPHLRGLTSPRGHAGQAHAAAGGLLLYHGGPVLHSEAPYLIFWEPSGHAIPADSKTVMTQYMTDVAADSGAANNVYGVLTQYTDGSGSAAYRQTFSSAQVIDDTQAYPATNKNGGCPLGTGTSACVTDAQLQGEIARLITTRHLPTGTGPGAPIYFMVTPQDVNICLTGGACSSNNFCAYHDYFTTGGSSVLYSSVPFSIWASGSTKACQADGTSLYQTPDEDRFQQPFFGDKAYIVADDLSHELSETVTDPLINAWYTSGFGSEVADICEAFASTSNPSKDVSAHAYFPTLAGTAAGADLVDQHFSSHYYYNQTEWSNRAGDCLAAPSA